MENYCFEIELDVRDYECDLQGIVNNAVYLNYLEHARHEYLRSRGLDFADLHAQGHDLVLTRCELEYKSPLRSGDRFAVRLALEPEGRIRFAFEQEILKLPERTPVLRGRLVGTCLNAAGRPERLDFLWEILGKDATKG